MLFRYLLLPAVLSISAINQAMPAEAQTDRDNPLRAIAERILAFQDSGGAIAMDPVSPPRDTRVIPYFATFAARGLVCGYQVSHDRRFLDGACRWASWYESRMNPNGTVEDFTGRPGDWKPTGDFDSTDSYAATYLDLLLHIQQAAQDQRWLRARLPSVRKAIDAIKLTLQQNGLTIAKPSYPVMYTMDNTETALGLRAAQKLGGILADRALEQESAALADRMERSIQENLWDAERQSYIIGLQTDGYRHRGLEKWYPDIMANLMAVAWLRPSQRNRDLFGRLKARFGDQIPERASNPDEIGRLVWWAYAASGAGDRSLRAQICNRFTASESTIISVAPLHDLGHIARLLSAK